MSDDDERRAATEQAVSRDANELVEEIGSAWKEPSDMLEVRCECSRPGCRATLRLSLAEYESVREDPRHFVVLPEHADASVDRVVGSIRRYALVEKVGAAADVAEETDRRS
ncbi:MAG TPA: hypothetical protein VLB86_16300 [Gaiellaceae bacterium]|nr:hypothetical protein [Gaiellaceae bacterium]